MKFARRRRLAALVFAAVSIPAAAQVQTADWRPLADAGTATAPPNVNDGDTWVWLRNDRVMVGNVRVGTTSITVRRIAADRSTSEITIPRHQIRMATRDRQELFSAAKQSKLRTSARDYVLFAQWCVDASMPDFASQVLGEGRRMMPEQLDWNAAAERILRPVGLATEPSPVAVVAHAESAAVVNDGPETDPGGPHFVEFSKSIEPLLTARCGHCHSRDSQTNSTGWSIAVSPRRMASPADSRQNYRELTQQLAADSRFGATLLRQAMSAHGDSRQPPLTRRHAEAAERLRRWLFTSVAEPNVVVMQDSPARLPEKLRSTSGIRRLPAVENPTDPEIFNRQTLAKELY